MAAVRTAAGTTAVLPALSGRSPVDCLGVTSHTGNNKEVTVARPLRTRAVA